MIVFVLVGGGAAYLALLSGPAPAARIALVVLIAFLSVQAGFLAHDAGDGGITTNRRIACGLSQILLTFVSATSASYFEQVHSIHHQTLLEGRSGPYPVNPYELRWFKRLVSRNGIMFFAATICTRGLTAKLESIRYVLHNRKTTRLDQFLLALHALVWLLLPLPFIGIIDTATNYGLIALCMGPYIGTVLVLNHKGMIDARSQHNLPMIERITRSTRNLTESWWSDLVFGGVNNHIEHHLFSEIPTIRLPRARKITRAFCRHHGIPYTETNFFGALVEAVRYFRGCPRDRLVIEALA